MIIIIYLLTNHHITITPHYITLHYTNNYLIPLLFIISLKLTTINVSKCIESTYVHKDNIFTITLNSVLA